MSEAICDQVRGIRREIDQLLDVDFAVLTPGELVEFATQWEVEWRRAAAVTQGLVAALGSSGAPGEFAYRDVAALLVDLLRLGPGEARARVAQAELLAPRQALTGETLDPTFATIASAQRAGAVSGEQVRVMLRALDALPPSVEPDVRSGVESTLVELAEQVGPRQLAVAAQRVIALADPDGVRPTEDEHLRRRSVTVVSDADGSGRLRGRLTPELLAMFKTVLNPLAAPAPGVDGEPDPRSAEQRCHDGLLDLCHRAIRDGELPATGGVPTTLILTMTEREFRAKRGFAATVQGDLIPAATAARMADQADVVSVVLNSSGGVLDYGRTRRLASPGQRCAIYARDRGCSFPGCTTPASWCQVHHVLDWLHGGDTAVDNMALLCGHHHRTFEAAGWRVVMHDGIPWWIPPPHLDPGQAPRRNRYWRTPELA